MMYDPSLELAALRLLERWSCLPFSDLFRMLDPLQRPRFRPEIVDDMEREGLIMIRSVGDERVLELTDRGRARLTEGAAARGTPPTSEV